ncbi:MAG: chitobiase/beta-hexosaminidase C-terminal domain-containing protein [Prevotella sp.]|nr:chitobiase/beta-hexosaminidase C-terminal domain-containing protein [Prevotella sp.]MBR6591112.1 chitobiase/beta-hexosaminidase C-terminal domain-containing protein [Prevotella sp.]
MRRLFTLAALVMVMAMSANAQDAIRKSWDFREFSTKTINALKADMEEYGPNKHWRNYESDATKAGDQSFWCAGDIADADGNPCTWSADVATPIEEFEGLNVPGRKAKKFVVSYNASQKDGYADSPNGMHPYGKSFLWLNGKNETFTFKAYCGQEIKIGVESHSNAQDRGIGLTTSAGSLELLSGKPTPTFFNECVWKLDGDPTELATLTIKSTNGCHIYYIIVGDGVNPEKANKVAYLYSGDYASDAAYNKLMTNEDYRIVPVDATATTITNETLAEYRTTVISPSVPVEKATELKAILPYNPVLNLNAAMYAAWGYGETVEASPLGMVYDVANYTKLPIFKDVELIVDESNPEAVMVGMDLATEGAVGAVKFNEYFAEDDTIMVSMDDPTAVIVHQHNMMHNGYIYIAYNNAASEGVLQMINNSISMLDDSKSEVTAVACPKIEAEYKHLNTNVTMAAVPATLPKAQVFYTTDGTEPTINSTLYTGVINFTESTTIKAIATAEGYNQSEVETFQVEIYEQPATPTISFTANGATSEVTIACATEGADVWYNFTGSNDTTQSMKYTVPFTLKENTDVTAFSETLDKVYSEPANMRVLIKDPIVRLDEIAHFNGQIADLSNNHYFFGMKNGLSIYDDMGEILGTNEDGSPIFPVRKDTCHVIAPDSNFVVKSNGQELIYQVLTIGKDPGNGEGYNPATAADVSDMISKNCIQFGKKVSGEPFTGRIETTKKYQAPFNLLAFIGTSSGSKAQMIFQVSADGENWKDANTDTMYVNNIKRLWSKYTVSYEGTDEVYVRIMQVGGSSGSQVYDFYLLTEGEQSAIVKEEMKKEWDAYATGIECIEKPTTDSTPSAIYNVNGMRINSLQRGLNIVKMSDGTAKKIIIK